MFSYCCFFSGSEDFISSLLTILRKCDQSVLLVSSNNTAIDNVLRPLKTDSSNKILRLGPMTRTHSDLKENSPEFIASQESFEAFCGSMRAAGIVATTAGGSHRQPGLMHREFDVCVVNEASLLLQPSIFGFLFLARRFLIIGDSTKRPNVRCVAAVEMGMNESLMSAMEATAVEGQSWIVI